jgi:hypothetical protein
MSASLCDVCGERPSAGVGAMPGVPVSFAYCKDCLKANAHPYAMVVANTAMLGGLERTATWWQSLVKDTLAHLGKTHEEFEASVLADMQEFEAAEARANEEFARTEEGQEHCISLNRLPQDGGAAG